MYSMLIITLYALLSFCNIFSNVETIASDFNFEPIDVVIPCTAKDLPTLTQCIEGIRKYGKDIRRIIVVSDKKLTDQAEWFDEKNFKFSKLDIAFEIFKDQDEALDYVVHKNSRIGWIYQQLLKLYAPLTIPNISSNVLILDSDTIFLKPISFFDGDGRALYNVGNEYHPPYFEHMRRLLPDLKRVFYGYSGITNHMIFQRHIIEELCQKIENFNNIELWRAMCRYIDREQLFHSGCSEYEIYFNFIFDHSNQKQCQIRPLKWLNTDKVELYEECVRNGYDYVSLHCYDGYLP